MPLQAGQTRLSRIRHAAAPGLLIAALFAGAPSALGAVTISSDATSNMSCSNGVCTPLASDAVLNVSDLENLLISGNVTVTTTGSGVQAADIDVKSALSWSNASLLSLDAYDSIAVSKAVSVAGPGALSLTTNDGGSGGTLSFGEKGSAGFQNLSSILTIDGAAFTLVNSISVLAAAIRSNPAGNFALANDYDASQDGTYVNAPITTTLTGIVEGLGNTISKLSIDHPKGRGGGYFGLFAQVANGGTIASLKLTGLNFRGRGAQHAGTDIGGLVGLNEGLLFDDHAAGVIAVKRMGAGGLAGLNVNGATISSSSANVRIRATANAGGLVWENYASTITLSHAGGSITVGTNGGAGGLVGNNEGEISASYATGTATGGDESLLGGLAGADQGGIMNSYAMGDVTGGSNAWVGGLVGDDDGNGEVDSYSTGHVSGGLSSFVGGFVGVEGADDKDCYWDSTTSGTDQATGEGTPIGITGLTTKQFRSGLPAGFDSAIWGEKHKINGGLPYLLAIPPK